MPSVFKKIASRRKANDDNGFTLIELMITMLVMGILAGITVFGLAQFQANAKASCNKAADKIGASAQRAWVAEDPSVRTLTQPLNANGLAAGPTEADLVTAGYLEALRVC